MTSPKNELQHPLLETYPPLPSTKSFTSKHAHEEQASGELEQVLCDTGKPFSQRLKPALWIESKLLVVLAAPAIIVYMINYVMSMSTQMFCGHLGNLELAASSLGNNGIQIFAYGLLLALCVERKVEKKDKEKTRREMY
ncbi:protein DETOXIFICATION 40-like isoform X1 [Pyrus x bretschneideri]|uniref:protein DETOXIFICATION 40-like isoform X1 n=1 Tax=Pyrus x bretschneideri TaxID=225117 RepID=UPI002030C82C|nr:protein DETOXIFICATION 40-like isoform X1 [Pyrus x bretschneideri]